MKYRKRGWLSQVLLKNDLEVLHGIKPQTLVNRRQPRNNNECAGSYLQLHIGSQRNPLISPLSKKTPRNLKAAG